MHLNAATWCKTNNFTFGFYYFCTVMVTYCFSNDSHILSVIHSPKKRKTTRQTKLKMNLTDSIFWVKFLINIAIMSLLWTLNAAIIATAIVRSFAHQAIIPTKTNSRKYPEKCWFLALICVKYKDQLMSWTAKC